MLIKPLLHSSVFVADSKMGILLPSSFPQQTPKMASWSPAHRFQQVQLSCLCPPRKLSDTPHQWLQYLPQATRTQSCLLGWRGKNLVCSGSPGTGRICWSGVCVGLEKEKTSAHVPAWHLFQEHVLQCPSQSWSCVSGRAAGVCWPVMHPGCSPEVSFHSPSAKAVQLHAQSLYPFKSKCSEKHILPACSTQLHLLIFIFLPAASNYLQGAQYN